VEEAYDMEILKISKITSGEIGLLKNADIRLDSCLFFSGCKELYFIFWRRFV
jgi:hypothetical protein